MANHLCVKIGGYHQHDGCGVCASRESKSYHSLNIIGGLQPRWSRCPMYSAVPDIPGMLDSPNFGGMVDVDSISIDFDMTELVIISIISMFMPVSRHC